MRTIRNKHGARAIYNIANIIVSWNFISTKFRNSKINLIYIQNRRQHFVIDNWHPITIFSLLCYVIEGSLDQKLKNRV